MWETSLVGWHRIHGVLRDESGQDVLTYVRGRTEYGGTAGKITREGETGNFRSSPAAWVITKNGKPALAQ